MAEDVDFQTWLTRAATDVITDTAQAVDVEAMLARLLRRHPAVLPSTVLLDPFTDPQLVAAIDRLGERDRLIVTLYYVQNLTLPQIGQKLGVTVSRACQLHGRAMSRLRDQLNDQTDVPGTPPRTSDQP